MPLRIGVSACFFHADPNRNIFKGKTLLYVEQQMAQWVMAKDAIPIMIPTASGNMGIDHVLDLCDGFLLQGGSDIAPETYGETPIRPEWGGDRIRDIYEIELVHRCMERDIPIFGVCRGFQVINVALGGTMYQDINHQIPGTDIHRNGEIYDQLFHQIEFVEGSLMADVIHKGERGGKVNSIHHQAVKDLAPSLESEAYAVPDTMIIEALKLKDMSADTPFVYGVQWHPEFQDVQDQTLLSSLTLLDFFYDEIRRRKKS